MDIWQFVADFSLVGKGGTEIGFGASVYDCSFVLAHYLEMNRSVVSVWYIIAKYLRHFIDVLSVDSFQYENVAMHE